MSSPPSEGSLPTNSTVLPTATTNANVSPPPPPATDSGRLPRSALSAIIIGAVFMLIIGFIFCCGYLTQRRNRSSPPPRPPGTSLSLPNIPRAFTYDELKAATEEFSQSNLLGQGGFGNVYKGVLPNGETVAVKQLNSESRQGETEFRTEVLTISRVHHRNLVSLVGYCISDSQRMLVYNFVPNKTLEFHLHGEGGQFMDWSTRMKIATGSAKALAYLHDDCNPRIIHRDIQASNILLDNNFEAKVADFGLAKFSSDSETHLYTEVKGTIGYLDPEYFRSSRLTDKSDVYSFGVVLLELITGRKPIDHTLPTRSTVEWARRLLSQGPININLDELADPRLQANYNLDEMIRMTTCARACVRETATTRPQMSLVLRALEGNAPLEELNEGIL